MDSWAHRPRMPSRSRAGIVWNEWGRVGPGPGEGGRATEGDRDLGGGNTGARTVVGEMLRDLEARFPWLARWSGGRLDIELPALGLSLLMHGLILAGLAFAGYQVHREAQREFRSELMDNRLPSDLAFQDLDQSA